MMKSSICRNMAIIICMCGVLVACSGNSNNDNQAGSGGTFTGGTYLEKQSAILAAPTGILLNQTGRQTYIGMDEDAIYIRDTANSVILKYSFASDRVVMTLAQNGFDQLQDTILVGQNSIYASHGSSSIMQKYSKAGAFLGIITPTQAFDPYTDAFNIGDLTSSFFIAGFSENYVYMRPHSGMSPLPLTSVSLFTRADLVNPVSTIDLLQFTGGNTASDVICRGDKMYVLYSVSSGTAMDNLAMVTKVSGTFTKIYDKLIPAALFGMSDMQVNSKGIAATVNTMLERNAADAENKKILVVYIADADNTGSNTTLSYQFITGLDVASSSQGLPDNVLYNVHDAVSWDSATAYATKEIFFPSPGNTYNTLNTSSIRLMKINKTTGSLTDVTGSLPLGDVQSANMVKYNNKLYIAGFSSYSSTGGSLSKFIEVTDPVAGTFVDHSVNFGDAAYTIAGGGQFGTLVGSGHEICGIAFESPTSAILAVYFFVNNGASSSGELNLYRYNLQDDTLALLPNSFPESMGGSAPTQKIPIYFDSTAGKVYLLISGEVYSYAIGTSVWANEEIMANAISVNNGKLYTLSGIVGNNDFNTRGNDVLNTYSLAGVGVLRNRVDMSLPIDRYETSSIVENDYLPIILFNVDSTGAMELLGQKSVSLLGYDDSGTVLTTSRLTGVYEYVTYMPIQGIFFNQVLTRVYNAGTTTSFSLSPQVSLGGYSAELYRADILSAQETLITSSALGGGVTLLTDSDPSAPFGRYQYRLKISDGIGASVTTQYF